VTGALLAGLKCCWVLNNKERQATRLSIFNALHAQITMFSQNVICIFTHQSGELCAVRDVDGLTADVRLGIAGAVPIEIIAAITLT